MSAQTVWSCRRLVRRRYGLGFHLGDRTRLEPSDAHQLCGFIDRDVFGMLIWTIGPTSVEEDGDVAIVRVNRPPMFRPPSPG